MTSQSDFGGPELRRPLLAHLVSAQGDPLDSRIFVVYTPPSERPKEQTARFETDATICDRCGDVLEYMSYFLGYREEKGSEASSDLYSAACLHENLASLGHSSNELNCYICINLARQFEMILIPQIIGKKFPDVPIEVAWTKDDGQDSWRMEFALRNPDHERATSNHFTFFRFRLWPADKMNEVFSRPTTELPQPTGKEIFVMPSSNGSSESRTLALQWFHECQNNVDGRHDECNRGISGFLPTRLLDVEFALNERKLRLVDGQDISSLETEDLRYATLSHCWGHWGIAGLPSLKTDNLQDRHDTGLDWDEIPATFQHALYVAGWFGVKWLWIDSLCIIQDDDSDWRHEAAEMAKIYKHALFNIAADAAKDARGGLFRSRSKYEILPMRLGFPDISETYVVAREGHDSIAWLQDGPLSQRAWVFQERQLARRVLHFTRNELFWECCVKGPAIASETFPKGVPVPRAAEAPWDARGFDHFSKYQTLLSSGSGSNEILYDIWDKLCHMYSAKLITYKTDKLIALSGLAKEFSELLPNDSYVAGHWYSTLPGSLMWKTEQGKPQQPTPGFLEQTAYVAPSWSWVSHFGPLSFEIPDNRDILASVVDVDVKTVGDDPTGALKFASLTLHGFLRKITVFTDFKAPSVVYHEWHKMRVDGGVKIIGQRPMSDGGFYIRLDNDGHPVVFEAFFLCIGYEGRLHPREGDDAKSTLTLHGLLLVPAGDGDGRYKKIGTMGMYGENTVDMTYERSNVSGEDASEVEEESFWSDLRTTVGHGRSKIELDESQRRQSSISDEYRDMVTERLAAAGSDDLEARLYAGDGEYDESLFSRLQAQVVVLV